MQVNLVPQCEKRRATRFSSTHLGPFVTFFNSSWFLWSVDVGPYIQKDPPLPCPTLQLNPTPQGLPFPSSLQVLDITAGFCRITWSLGYFTSVYTIVQRSLCMSSPGQRQQQQQQLLVLLRRPRPCCHGCGCPLVSQQVPGSL
jgi:hypothetical protein